jgi:hypothetical protein
LIQQVLVTKLFSNKPKGFLFDLTVTLAKMLKPGMTYSETLFQSELNLPVQKEAL